ncbi:MAG: hypothetical protein JWP20_421 [Roseomonas sp.]|jgi:hypothetical protein|nr:hypothetical protein [Roseomonas sp.]
MNKIPFAMRLAARGLSLPAAEAECLEKLVRDLDKATEIVRGDRPYGEEPLSAFRLTPAAV